MNNITLLTCVRVIYYVTCTKRSSIK